MITQMQMTKNLRIFTILSYSVMSTSKHSKALPAKRTRKSTQVFNLHSTCVSFGQLLVMTLVELKFVSKSTQVFHRLATQCKLTQVDRKASVYARFFVTCVNLRADLRFRLATHRKSVRKFWVCKLALTFVDL